MYLNKIITELLIYSNLSENGNIHMTHSKNSLESSLSTAEIKTVFQQVGDAFSSTTNSTAELPIILGKMTKRIEHTLLKMDATEAQLTQLCREAMTHSFRGICCLQRHIPHCRSVIKSSDVLIISVVDFPLCGASAPDVAVLARHAISDGADEIDMVLDVSSLKSGRLPDVFDRIARVTDVSATVPVKVILETACLSENEIVTACAIARAAGAAFVKTSTGFAARGASVRDIEIMKTAVGDTMRIKASGGIKDAAFAAQLVNAGADVIGTSAGPVCIQD